MTSHEHIVTPNRKIMRLALLSAPYSDSDRPLIATDIPRVLADLHGQDAALVNPNRRWHVPRLGSLALSLGTRVPGHVAHDTCVLIDEAIDPANPDKLERRFTNLREEFMWDSPTFRSRAASFLADTHISAEHRSSLLMAPFTIEYARTLAQVWTERVGFVLSALLKSPVTDLINVNQGVPLTGADAVDLLIRREYAAVRRHAREINGLRPLRAEEHGG